MISTRRHLATSEANEVGVGGVKLFLEPLDLSLEEGDGSNATVDGVSDSGLSLIGEGVHGVLSLVRRELVEELGDVAGAEDLVDIGELLGLLGGEVRGEYAPRHAFPPQELARRAWRVVRARGCHY